MSFNYGYIVDASRQKGDEGRGVTAISFGEVSSNLRTGDFRMGQPSQSYVWLSAQIFRLLQRKNGA